MNIQLFAAEPNLTETLTKANSIDFAEQFGKQLGKLTELLGVQRKMAMNVGSTINTYTSSVTLDGTVVPKGDIIPLSEVKLEKGPVIELEWDKKRKAVAAEDIQTYGFEQALNRTDAALLRELQKGVRGKLIGQLKTGTGTATGAGLQAALANAWGGVQTAFEDDDVMTIAFVNTMDIADYLGKAQITIQSAFGLNYIENFLGVNVVVVSPLITAGTFYATAADNLVLAYANVAGGEIDKAFDFVTEETGLIGVTHDINKQRLTAETITFSGLVLFAERLDGVIKGSITPVVPGV